MAAWSRITALIVKEFLAILKEPRSRFVVVGPPIIQMLVFGYAATYDLKDVPYAVYNEDRGFAARDLLARFEESPSFSKAATIAHDQEIAPLVDRGAVLMVVRVDRDFTSDLVRGMPASVQIIVDGRNSNTATIALGYARTIIHGFNDDWAAARGLPGPPARLHVRAWFNPNLESRWFIVPAIAGLLTLVVTMVVTSLSVAREREHGTFDQLLVTPLRPVEILLGKALPGVLIGLAEGTVVILVAVFWFHIPLRGSILALYAGLAVFLASAIGIGLMISSLAVTMQQGLLGAFLFLVPAVILSGFTTPIANMPEAVQYLTLLNPLRYLVEIIRGVFLEGRPLALMIDQFWPMAVIAAVTLTLAGLLFRRRLY